MSFWDVWLKRMSIVLVLLSLFNSYQGLSIEITKNPEKIEVSLLTIGRGEAVYALFGHTILRLKDLETGIDVGFNWGIFDFHNKMFVWNFYRGNLRYQMAMTPTQELLQHYRVFERRYVIEDKIRLTETQKLRLIERLQWNLQPENVAYDYEQFKDNCSTRPRDHIDFALSGAIKSRFGKMNSGRDFRSSIRDGALLVPWVYLGLDQMTNDLLDRQMTVWESMFIPSSLRSYLLEMPAVDDQGQVREGENLLYGPTMLVDLEEPRPYSNPYALLSLFLVLPAVVFGVLAIRFKNSIGRFSLRVLWGGFGLYSGLLGLILTLNYFVSGYPQLKNWIGLLIFNPLDILFVALACGFFAFGKGWIFKIYMFGKFVLVILALYIWSAGLIKQDIVGVLSTGGILVIWVSMISLMERAYGGEREA